MPIDAAQRGVIAVNRALFSVDVCGNAALKSDTTALNNVTRPCVGRALPAPRHQKIHPPYCRWDEMLSQRKGRLMPAFAVVGVNELSTLTHVTAARIKSVITNYCPGDSKIQIRTPCFTPKPLPVF
jgi:hypothetical protein